MRSPDVSAAYAHCLAMARAHYENFPVASRLVPGKIREPIAAIYAFARIADDYADEGDHEPEDRVELLTQHRNKLHDLDGTAAATDPVFVAVKDAIDRFELPVGLFDDLISAFLLDVSKTRYATFDEVLAYCRWSANPVGRLLLYLFDFAREPYLSQSDAICSGLQLVNFWQDLEQDFRESNRIYVPLDDMHRFDVSEAHFAQKKSDVAFRRLMTFEIARARRMLLSGAPLAWALPGRIGLEIRLTLYGGLKVAERLGAQHEDFFTRPRLRKRDWLAVMLSGLFCDKPPVV